MHKSACNSGKSARSLLLTYPALTLDQSGSQQSPPLAHPVILCGLLRAGKELKADAKGLAREVDGLVNAATEDIKQDANAAFKD